MSTDTPTTGDLSLQAGTATPADSPAVSPAPGQNDTGAGFSPPRADDVDAAFERAAARRTASQQDSSGSADAAGQTAPPTDADAPAAEGASTRADDSAAEPATTDSATPTDGPASQEAGDSIVTAPDDWPSALRERFDALGDQDARRIVLDMQRDLQAGFTKATQKLAEARTALPARAQELLAIDEQFSANPREVIAGLARDAGIDVFFEREGPAEEVPEFESAADMARWAREQAFKQLKADMAAEREAQTTAEHEQQARQALQAELNDAEKIPGFAEARPQVLARLRDNPNLSVSDAFTLVQAGGLRKLAEDGQRLKAENASLRKELESMKKRSTAPLRGVGAGSEQRPAEGYSATETAFERAARKVAKGRASVG